MSVELGYHPELPPTPPPLRVLHSSFAALGSLCPSKYLLSGQRSTLIQPTRPHEPGLYEICLHGQLKASHLWFGAVSTLMVAITVQSILSGICFKCKINRFHQSAHWFSLQYPYPPCLPSMYWKNKIASGKQHLVQPDCTGLSLSSREENSKFFRGTLARVVCKLILVSKEIAGIIQVKKKKKHLC